MEGGTSQWETDAQTAQRLHILRKWLCANDISFPRTNKWQILHFQRQSCMMMTTFVFFSQRLSQFMSPWLPLSEARMQMKIKWMNVLWSQNWDYERHESMLNLGVGAGEDTASKLPGIPDEAQSLCLLSWRMTNNNQMQNSLQRTWMEICHLLPHWVLTVPEQEEHADPNLSVSLCCFSTSNIRTLEIPKVLLEDFGSHPSKIMKLLWNILGRHLIELYFCVCDSNNHKTKSHLFIYTLFLFPAVRGHWWGE